MSIIRNVRSSTNKTVTIKRFAANQPLDTNTSGSAYPVGYIELSNYYMTPKTLSGVSYHSLHFAQNSSLIFKAEIRSGAKGPLFGSRQTNCLNIIVDDYNYEGSPVALRCILWRKGTTVIKAILASASTGIHKYGWVYGKVGSTTGMCCYYDGVLDNVQTTYFSDDLYVLRLDNSTDPMYAISDYAIRLYEIAGRLGLTASGSQSVDVHFYAVKFGTGPSYNPYMFDTRSDQAIYLEPTASSTTSGRNTTKSYGSDVTYGVQLHDLKYAFSSPYNDLIAIVCQDDSSRATTGADPADKLTNGTSTHNMAFRMADGTGTTPSNPVPLPSGYSVSRSGTYTHADYEKGDLIFGRQPKWNVWADGINWGKHVTGSSSSSRKLKFNIFKDWTGAVRHTGNKVDLLDFENYNNADSVNYPPTISMVSNVTVQFHNSVGVNITEANKIVGASSDRNCIFKYSLAALGQAKFRVGNAVMWNLSSTEQEANRKYQIYGASVELHFAKDGIASPDNVFASFQAVTPDISGGYYVPFSTNSQASTKTAWKSTGVTASATTIRYNLENMYHEFQLNSFNPLPMIPTMALLNTESSYTGTVSMAEIIDFTRVNINGAFDTAIYGGNADRFIFGDEDGCCTIVPTVTISYKTVTPADGKTYAFHDYSDIYGTSESTIYWHHLSYSQYQNPRIRRDPVSQAWVVTDLSETTYHVMSNGLSTDGVSTQYPASNKSVTYTNAKYDILIPGYTGATGWGDYLYSYLFPENSTGAACFGFTFALRPHTLASGEVGYTHKLVDFNTNEIEMVAFAEVTFCLSGNMKGKFFGFTQAYPAEDFNTINNITGPTMGRSGVNPYYWRNTESGSDYQQEIHYRDSNGVRDRRAVIWKWSNMNGGYSTRPTTIGTSTTHVQMFDYDNAPHSFNLKNITIDGTNFNPTSGCFFYSLGSGTSTRYYVVHNCGTLYTGTTTYLNAATTVWKTLTNPVDSDQITSSFPTFNIRVYRQMIDIADYSSSIVEFCTITGISPTTSVQTKNSNVTGVYLSYRVAKYTGYATLPTGLGDVQLPGFVMLQVMCSNSVASENRPQPGDMFYLEFY